MWAVRTLTYVLKVSRDLERAADLASESLARHQRLFGQTHPDTKAVAEELEQIRVSLSEGQKEGRRQEATRSHAERSDE